MSVPHVVLDKYLYKTQQHLLFKEVMCGMKDNWESNIRPINFASPILEFAYHLDKVEDLNVVSVVDKK